MPKKGKQREQRLPWKTLQDVQQWTTCFSKTILSSEWHSGPLLPTLDLDTKQSLALSVLCVELSPDLGFNTHG